MKLNKKYATAGVLVLKSGKMLKAIKIIKLFKFAKPLITMISVVLSLFAYSMAYSVSLGIMLIVMMFVHELGHVYAINKEGLKAGRMIFIPFFGAMVGAPKGMDRRQEAVVGIGGPWLGSLFAYLFIAVYFTTHNDWFLHAGYLGLVLNLFNMIPVHPLDGGRVTQATGKYFNIIGLAMLIALTIAMKTPMLLLIWIIALIDLQWFGYKFRLISVLAIELALIVMLITGTGIGTTSEFWTVFIDIIIGALVIAGFWATNYKLSKEERQALDRTNSKPALNLKAKIGWFLVWFLTTILLLGSIMWIVIITKLQS